MHIFGGTQLKNSKVKNKALIKRRFMVKAEGYTSCNNSLKMKRNTNLVKKDWKMMDYALKHI